MTAIAFGRLPDVPLGDVVRLLNEPRNARHMPLAGAMSDDDAATWVRDKDAQWGEHGYGPWAVLVDGAFAGWGGFQNKDGDADFALVLDPRYRGYGEAIARRAFDVGFDELGLEEIVIALPYSRRPDRAVARLGFEPAGETEHGDGIRFRRFRLTRPGWSARAAS